MNISAQAVIGELVDSVKTWNPVRSDPEQSFTYIDLSAIDREAKTISGEQIILCSDAPSRARQLVRAGDVLVSTVRPNLNGVALVPDYLDGATASTGFCILRSRSSKLDARYLFHWVKSPRFLGEMTNRATGASYPAVTDRIVQESKIPLPPLPEQKRIAAILDKADALRIKRQAALAKLGELTQSIFLEMFGDPVANTKNWNLVQLGDLGSVDRGISKHRPRNAPELLKGPYPFVQTGDVANSDGYVRTYTSTYSEIGLQQSKLWDAGTLCITIAANIARTGILTFPACFPDSVVGFNAKEPATVEYVRVLFSFFQQILEKQAPESAQKNINLKILRSLRVPDVPEELQRSFLKRIQAIRSNKEKMTDALALEDSLFASLQHRAFSGTL